MKKYFLPTTLMYMTVLPAGHTRSVVRRRVNFISKETNNQYAQNKPFIRQKNRLKRRKEENQKDWKPQIFRGIITISALIVIHQVLSTKPTPAMGSGGGGGGGGGGALDTKSTADILSENNAFAQSDDTLVRLPPGTTIPLVALKNANPFKLKDGFKTFKIDWESSTLDVTATVASMKEHKDKLLDPIKHAKYAWSYFIAMKLLGKDYILKDDELIELLYTHFPTYDYGADYSTELKGQQLVEAFKKNASKPQYFHRTPKFDGALIPMLQSGLIKRTYNRSKWGTSNIKPGAFVGVGQPASAANYGDYMLHLKDLEYDDIPLTNFAIGSYWAGFFNDIDLKKNLAYISLPHNEQYRIDKVEQELAANGYTDVGVYTESELETIVYNNKISMPTIVPKFWLSSNMRTDKKPMYFAKNQNQELMAITYKQFYPKELGSEYSITFAHFSRY